MARFVAHVSEPGAVAMGSKGVLCANGKVLALSSTLSWSGRYRSRFWHPRIL